tara:strand:+ start:107 stop:667 length:561 start_codon:yes stop_codon:yes gene_type:complete
MKRLILLSALLIIGCKNKIDHSAEVSEDSIDTRELLIPKTKKLIKKQSPSEFFSYAPESNLIMKSWNCWGPNELKPRGTMEQRLIEDLKVNRLNPKGYIFYRKQKIYRSSSIRLDKTVLIKYGPLIISDSIYSNNFHKSKFRIEATEVNRFGDYQLYPLVEDKAWSLKNSSNDSVINIPIKITIYP